MESRSPPALAPATSEARDRYLIYNARWSNARRERHYSQAPEDFAGPHKSFPITDQDDLDNAVRLHGHAENPQAVKMQIKSIARRKGLSLPDEWESEDDYPVMNEVYSFDYAPMPPPPCVGLIANTRPVLDPHYAKLFAQNKRADSSFAEVDDNPALRAAEDDEEGSQDGYQTPQYDFTRGRHLTSSEMVEELLRDDEITKANRRRQGLDVPDPGEEAYDRTTTYVQPAHNAAVDPDDILPEPNTVGRIANEIRHGRGQRPVVNAQHRYSTGGGDPDLLVPPSLVESFIAQGRRVHGPTVNVSASLAPDAPLTVATLDQLVETLPEWDTTNRKRR